MAWSRSAKSRLGGVAAGPAHAEIYAAKVAAMTRSATVAASGIEATDLVVLVLGLATAWFINPNDLLAADGRDPQDDARVATHRAALVEAARRVTAA